jgi:hypothetical protein
MRKHLLRMVPPYSQAPAAVLPDGSCRWFRLLDILISLVARPTLQPTLGGAIIQAGIISVLCI